MILCCSDSLGTSRQMNSTQWELSISLLRDKWHCPTIYPDGCNSSHNQVSHMTLVYWLAKRNNRDEFVDALNGSTDACHQPIFLFNAFDVGSVATEKRILVVCFSGRRRDDLSRNDKKWGCHGANCSWWRLRWNSLFGKAHGCWCRFKAISSTILFRLDGPRPCWIMSWIDSFDSIRHSIRFTSSGIHFFQNLLVLRVRYAFSYSTHHWKSALTFSDEKINWDHCHIDPDQEEQQLHQIIEIALLYSSRCTELIKPTTKNLSKKHREWLHPSYLVWSYLWRHVGSGQAWHSTQECPDRTPVFLNRHQLPLMAVLPWSSLFSRNPAKSWQWDWSTLETICQIPRLIPCQCNFESAKLRPFGVRM